MSKNQAIKALEQPENEAIEFVIGSLLRQHIDKDGWEQITLLQHLAQSSPRLEHWNGLFSRARKTLADPNDLAIKGAQLLEGVNTSRFNDALDDFIAEMLALIYLAESGHTAIRFPPNGGSVTVDLESRFEDAPCFTEVKNLREPRSLSFVAFKRWNWNRTIHQDQFTFRADFLDLDDPLRDLTADQESAVNALVDGLPTRMVPSEFDHTLRVRLTEGSPVMLRHGSGPFLVGPVIEKARRFLVLKLMDPARKALSQLYRPEVPTNAKRLLFIRWKLPEEIAAIDESENVRSVVQEQCQTFLRSFFPNIAVTIMHTQEDPKDAPKATWT